LCGRTRPTRLRKGGAPHEILPDLRLFSGSDGEGAFFASSADHVSTPLPHKTKRHAKEILSYFIRNPQAADSLDGIVRWRLLSEVVNRKVEETRAALQWLVKQGLLVETLSPGIGQIFSLNPETIAEAQRILADARVWGSYRKKENNR
jgi:hypothetical protein